MKYMTTILKEWAKKSLYDYFEGSNEKYNIEESAIPCLKPPLKE